MIAQWIWNLRLELGHQLKHSRCAPPSLLLPSQSIASRPPPVQPHPLLPLDTAHPLPLLPGKQGVSLELTFLSNPMGRCAVRLGSLFILMSGVEKPMAVCVWCTQPASAVVVLVRCASSANGKAAKPRSRVR